MPNNYKSVLKKIWLHTGIMFLIFILFIIRTDNSRIKIVSVFLLLGGMLMVFSFLFRYFGKKEDKWD